jgi:hypothetical protein
LAKNNTTNEYDGIPTRGTEIRFRAREFTKFRILTGCTEEFVLYALEIITGTM